MDHLPKEVILFLSFWGIAFLVSFVVGAVVGRERKIRWFKQRTQSWLFNRRGQLGNTCYFGRPCTKEGYGIVLLILGISLCIECIIFGRDLVMYISS